MLGHSFEESGFAFWIGVANGNAVEASVADFETAEDEVGAFRFAVWVVEADRFAVRVGVCVEALATSPQGLDSTCEGVEG